MTALRLLDEIVQEIEQDANLTRIKKLILFACKKIWENDSSKLELFSLRDLIEELRYQNSSFYQLQSTLNSRVNRTTKKSEYLLIAELIVTKLSKLYDEEDDRTLHLFSEGKNSDVSKAQTDIQKPSTFSQKSEGKKLSPLGDVFDLRQKLMQGTNPLIAKILMFSTLYHKFTFSDRDWALLKKQNLDDLLQTLFDACQTLNDLKSHLYRTAKKLENPDKSLQAANVILKTITPAYAALKNNSNPEQSSNVPPAGDTQIELNAAENQFNQAYDPSNDEPQHSQLIQVLINQTNVSKADDSHRQISSASPTAPQKPETTQSDQGARKFSLAARNISESIKQKREQEEKIKKLVGESVNAVMNDMENRLSELENSLEKELINEESEEYLSLKYQALGNFIKNVQETSVKYMEILRQLEEAERQRLS